MIIMMKGIESKLDKLTFMVLLSQANYTPTSALLLFLSTCYCIIKRLKSQSFGIKNGNLMYIFAEFF